VDPLERKIQEREYAKRLELAKRRIKAIKPPVVEHIVSYSLREEAFNDIYGKTCVKKAFDYGSGPIMVVMEDMSMIKRLRKWVSKHYPTIDVEIIGESK
jgi:hypothetical protein